MATINASPVEPSAFATARHAVMLSPGLISTLKLKLSMLATEAELCLIAAATYSKKLALLL
ncbi:hypothetical protein D9M69_433860 [compost metagenome]